MKKFFALILVLAMVFSFAACSGKTPAEPDASDASDASTDAAADASDVKTPENPVIRLATTTSVNDSGLLPYLLPTFESETGYKVEVASAGTGVAIGYAKSGDADMLLVHSKKQEEAFIDEGYASTERLSFMYNFFVIVGPEADPAGIKDLATAADCFKAIAETKAPFASRGDNSGTHNKETGIWEAAEIDPSGESWYSSVGSGMGDTLNKANELSAYALTDKATFLSMKDSLQNLVILKAEADDMKNTYSLLGVNPEAEAFAGADVKINTEGANALIEWLLSDEAAELIAKYGVDEYGEQLFFLIEK
ncbi:MAG: substrate-binding domain-containing protein [Clostridia bacterium]|nr:substrate-binding domain-containing protein [Clostridia bacterium]